MDSNNMNNMGSDSQTNEDLLKTSKVQAEDAAPEETVSAENVVPAEETVQTEQAVSAQEIQEQQPAEEQAAQSQPEPQPMPQVPVQAANEPKKKGKGGLIAVIIIAIVLIIALFAAVGILVSGMFASPKSKVSKGFANMMEEIKEYQNPVMETIKMDQLQEAMAENGTTIDMSVNASVADSIGSFGVDCVMNVDRKSKEMDMNLAFSIMNYALFSTQFATDNESMYLSAPELFEGNLKFPVEGFAEKFNDSELAYLLGMEVPEEYEITLFDEGEDAASIGQGLEEYFGEEFMQTITDDVAAIAKAVKVEKYDETKKVDINGKKVECKGYLVSVAEEEINQYYADILKELTFGKFSDAVIATNLPDMAAYGYTEEDLRSEWEDMMEELTIELDGDLEVIVYLDRKNRIVSMEAKEIPLLICDEEFNTDFEINFLGEERTLDSIEAELKVDSGSTVTSFFLERVAEITKEERNDSWEISMIPELDSDEGLTFYFTNNWNIEDKEFYVDCGIASVDDFEMELEIEGCISEYEAGKSCTYEFEDITLYEGSEPIVMLSGELTQSELQEKIEIPTDAWDILDASESELGGFFMEIYDNIGSLFDMFY